MATVSRLLGRPFTVASIALVAGVTVGVVAFADGDHDGATGTGTGTAPSAVAVAATSSYQFDSLLEMAATSDAVVRATVVATERGRVVGDPGAGGIVSRIVTLDVSEVFTSSVPGLTAGATLLIEEEGWLPSGEVLIVDDLQPSTVDDTGVWFLDAIGDTDSPTFLVINSQGRFLDVDGRIVGGRIDDPLVDAVEAVDYPELIDTLRRLTEQRPDSQEPAP